MKKRTTFFSFEFLLSSSTDFCNLISSRSVKDYNFQNSHSTCLLLEILGIVVLKYLVGIDLGKTYLTNHRYATTTSTCQANISEEDTVKPKVGYFFNVL